MGGPVAVKVNNTEWPKWEKVMSADPVPLDELESTTLAMAVRIAQRPMIGLTLAKQSVNNSLDAMGMYTSIQSAFGLHHVGHNHNARVHGMLVDPAGAQVIRDDA